MRRDDGHPPFMTLRNCPQHEKIHLNILDNRSPRRWRGFLSRSGRRRGYSGAYALWRPQAHAPMDVRNAVHGLEIWPFRERPLQRGAGGGILVFVHRIKRRVVVHFPRDGVWDTWRILIPSEGRVSQVEVLEVGPCDKSRVHVAQPADLGCRQVRHLVVV